MQPFRFSSLLVSFVTISDYVQGDFFALELLEGHLYLHLDLGSGAVKVRAARRLNDGAWHKVQTEMIISIWERLRETRTIHTTSFVS